LKFVKLEKGGYLTSSAGFCQDGKTHSLRKGRSAAYKISGYRVFEKMLLRLPWPRGHRNRQGI